MTVRDQNGNRLTQNIKREETSKGLLWGVTVWFGGWNGLGTNVRRYYYKTRKEARNADISCPGDFIEVYTED
jgi:hypothetical protein